MGREFDCRRFKHEPQPSERQRDWHAAAKTISKALPGKHHIQIESFDKRRGRPRTVRSEAAPGERGDWVRRASAHLDRIGYQGWIGCEYKPATTTQQGLGWMKGVG